MSKVLIPTVGRQVHFFHGDNEKHTANNGCKVLPATVVQPFSGLTANLAVLCMNGDGPVVLRYSVSHKSVAVKGNSYWDWPERTEDTYYEVPDPVEKESVQTKDGSAETENIPVDDEQIEVDTPVS